MGDRVYHTSPITVDILLRIFQSFQPRNFFHACMRAAFLVAFFSFLRISNLVPYTLSEVHSSTSFFLRRRDTLFFFYKNLFYKNVEAEIDPNFKNVLRTFLRLRVD